MDLLKIGGVFVIYFTIFLSIFGIGFIIMGLYYTFAENPGVANFYANTKSLRDEDITDKKAYNNACGKIFILWGVLNTVIAIGAYFLGDHFIFILVLIPFTNIIAMAMYNINSSKYIKRG